MFQFKALNALLGPPVNSEYYPGWLDYWGEPHETRNADKIADSLDKYLSYQNASVTVFMAHGGTSFGLESGTHHLTCNFTIHHSHLYWHWIHRFYQ